LNRDSPVSPGIRPPLQGKEIETLRAIDKRKDKEKRGGGGAREHRPT